MVDQIIIGVSRWAGNFPPELALGRDKCRLVCPSPFNSQLFTFRLSSLGPSNARDACFEISNRLTPTLQEALVVGASNSRDAWVDLLKPWPLSDVISIRKRLRTITKYCVNKPTVPHGIFWMRWMCLNIWFTQRNIRWWRAHSLPNGKYGITCRLRPTRCKMKQRHNSAGWWKHWGHWFPTGNVLPSLSKYSVTDMWDYATYYLLWPPNSWTRRPWEVVRSFERSMARMAVKCWQFGEVGRIPARIGCWSSSAMWSKDYREWLWSEAVPVSEK